jgi:two-component system, chemotaxis family, CheB/CheR fusion protein
MKSKTPRRGERWPVTEMQPAAAPPSGGSLSDFLIAAIGASAGGVEASTELVRHLPSNTGMAFVLIQHLDPKHHSMLSEILAKETAMPVMEVKDRMKVQPDHIYVIPPDASMSISDHMLRLGPREETRGSHMPIDRFMRSLAEAQGNRSVGVILSGTGTDGTLGLAEIQAQGGVTLVQDQNTARHDGMPRSAIAADCVDFVLPPSGIARELARIARHPYVAPGETAAKSAVSAAEANVLSTIYQLLRRSTGVDFTDYRQTTIRRRIERRMVVHRIDHLEEYMKYLLTNHAEVKALCQDMLINVTSFFRNPKVFDAVKSEVFPRILAHRPREATLRMWTPGCASGEETYSLAIALLEFLGDKADQTPIQFFGTDVSETSVAKARSGWYPENIQTDVTPHRLRRFFTKSDGGYRISKGVRNMCIFAHHNTLSDPPFSQMDLICCRNLLIYLEPVLQNRLINLFHYATRPHGFLVLGTAEGIGSASSLFAIEDRAHRIFSKKMTAVHLPAVFSLNRQPDRPEQIGARTPSKGPDINWNYQDAQKEFDRRLLAQYSPASVFVNEDMEIIHTRGNVGPYLKLSPGRASLNLLKMAREGLLLDLRNAVGRAKKEKALVRKENVQVKPGNGNGEAHQEGSRLVSIEVTPLESTNSKELFFMVVFRDAPPAGRRSVRTATAKESESASRRIAKLEQELAATKEYLQSVIETHETTNEELQSANEEILSSNEELQSTNEELETAKEELQSTNEELSTVNDELRHRNEEMAPSHREILSLFASINIAVLMVGSDLRIRRFTPEAQKILGLISADIGRPLANINPNIAIPELQATILRVMTTSSSVDSVVTDHDGARYLLRVHAYPAAERQIDGAVLTLVPLPPLEKIAEAH